MDKPTFICHIHENSWLAALAAFKLRSKRVAITMGNHIFLWNADRKTFLDTESWLKHELCHVRQFRHYGFFTFLWLYLIESVRKGYWENKFEKEARLAEQAPDDTRAYSFISC